MGGAVVSGRRGVGGGVGLGVGRGVGTGIGLGVGAGVGLGIGAGQFLHEAKASKSPWHSLILQHPSIAESHELRLHLRPGFHLQVRAYRLCNCLHLQHTRATRRIPVRKEEG